MTFFESGSQNHYDALTKLQKIEILFREEGEGISKRTNKRTDSREENELFQAKRKQAKQQWQAGQRAEQARQYQALLQGVF